MFELYQRTKQRYCFLELVQGSQSTINMRSSKIVCLWVINAIGKNMNRTKGFQRNGLCMEVVEVGVKLQF